MPFAGDAARAVDAATAAPWFERRAFYAEARRVLVPGGVIAIVKYVRDKAGSPLAAALIEFMAQYGSQKAYAPADYRRELAEADGWRYRGSQSESVRAPSESGQASSSASVGRSKDA